MSNTPVKFQDPSLHIYGVMPKMFYARVLIFIKSGAITLLIIDKYGNKALGALLPVKVFIPVTHVVSQFCSDGLMCATKCLDRDIHGQKQTYFPHPHKVEA